MDKRKFLFASLPALISDIAWQVLKEGHDVRYYIEGEKGATLPMASYPSPKTREKMARGPTSSRKLCGLRSLPWRQRIYPPPRGEPLLRRHQPTRSKNCPILRNFSYRASSRSWIGWFVNSTNC